ncbi:hypothetical protein J132_11350 [Termitomyces sp. J132]|nr:hypothetical protein J132_11350 [Termitomyces sp. J132]
MSTDHFANLKHAIKHDSTQVIIAILQLPLFAFAIIGICNTAKAFPGSDSDCAQYIGMTHLHFANKSNYPRLLEQKGLVDMLSQILPMLDCLSANDTPDIQHFFSFADALILIDKKQHKEQCKCETQECEARDTEMLGLTPACSSKQKANAEPKGKPKLKKVKVTPSLTNFKLSSDAMLALLGQIDVTLKNCLLNEDNTAPLAKLQRHCSSEIEKTSSLLGNLQVSSKAPADDSDIELTDSPADSPENAMDLFQLPQSSPKNPHILTVDVITPKMHDLNKFSFTSAK